MPVAGPGLQGLQNLGNSCYMNSVVQMLLGGSIPELASRYGSVGSDVTKNPLIRISASSASNDLLCQAAKLSTALTSGVFCRPLPESVEVSDPSSSDPKYRLAPRMFKNVVGHDHVDFGTGQQQDAAQYFQYLLEKLDRAELGAGNRLKSKDDSDAALVTSHLFSYKTESRLVCEADSLIKYKESPAETMLSLRIPMSEATTAVGDAPDVKRQKSEDSGEDGKEKKEVPTVTIDACLNAWSDATTIDDCRWPHLQNAVSRATSTTRFANFPRYLLVHMQRYELGDDWQPHKIEVDIDVPEEISLHTLRSTGPQDGENLVPPESEVGEAPAVPSASTLDENALSQLIEMGFNMNGCKRALMAVGGSNVEAAMNWVFEHNGDADFNDPLPEGSESAGVAAASDSGVDEGVVMSLVENLGCFSADQVRAALKHCNGAADRAADWLFSHMDDLDSAIASLDNVAPAGNTVSSKSSVPLEDGDGKYNLVGLVSHIGKNTGSGHYVAHLKKDGKWVIFNDEKVALSEHPPTRHAYMYLFQRSDTVGSPHAGY